jgi:RimJ/RimL family protein N-acetyltransferase
MVEEFFRTERLILRGWKDEDRALFAEMNADPAVMAHFMSVRSRQQSDALVDYIEDQIDDRGYGLFAVERIEDGAFLGFTGFNIAPENTPIAGQMEIGWRLARAYWRLGYAYEAARACIAWFWRHADKDCIVSFTSSTNVPSQNLMRKLGLTHRPKLDFNHPAIPPEHRLCPQVVFAVDRPKTRNG